MYPNDEKEMDRLDIMHKLTEVTLGGKLNLAPIMKNPQRILDIGTGTGIWAIEIGMRIPLVDRNSMHDSVVLTMTLNWTGDKYPEAEVWKPTAAAVRWVYTHVVPETQILGNDLSPIQPRWYSFYLWSPFIANI